MERIFIIAGSIAGVVLLIFFFSYLKYKKVDVPGWFKKIESGISELKEVTEIIKDNSTGRLQAAANTASLIETVALNIVKGTEQKYLSGDVSAEDRKKTAVQAVQDFLTSQGIKVTDELKNVIDLAVSSAVKESGMSDVNKQIDAKVKAIEKDRDAIKANLTIATNENLTLKSQISTLQGKLSTIQNAVDTKNTAPASTTVPEQK